MKIKAFTSVIFLLNTISATYALNYADSTSSLVDFFESISDDNAGSTSFLSLNIPSGGRAESLGTAFTALADDISFFDYNPAASSIMDETEAAAYHNAWIADSAMETLAATTRYNNFGIAAALKCFYVPFTEYNAYGTKVASSYYSETTGIINFSYNFLSGYYFRGIAVGINLKTSWRNMPDYTDDNTNEIISSSGLSQSALAFMGDIGLLIRFNAAKFYSSRDTNFSFGLNIKNLGKAITGFGENIKEDDPLPTRICAGISYKPFKPITITAEFKQGINLSNISESELWAAGGGLEIRFTEFFSFLGGFLIQGSNPRISFGGETNIADIVLNANYTFDLTSSLNPVNHISISAKVKLGDKNRKAIAKKVDELYSLALEKYTEGNLEEAIAIWEQSLQLDKGFDPSKEGIKLAKEQLKLLKTILDLQKLD